MTIQIILISFIIVVAVFNINFTAGYKPVFYSSLIPLLLSPTLLLSLESNASSLFFGIVILCLFISFVFFYSEIHKPYLDALILGFKKTHQANELQQSILDKSRFFAASSHDLKQPLQAQILHIADLKRNVTNIRNKKVVHKLEQSTIAMRSMFDSFLDLSNLDSGVIEPNIQCFPVTRLLDELVVDFSAMALDKDLTFRIVESSLIIKSDPVLLIRIIRNLVSNSIKYTTTGGILIGCRRQNTSERSGDISIEVWDTGKGISTSNKLSIFDEYYQLDNPERNRDNGIGLGLAIVKRLASLLNHPISFQSTFNRGSVFSVLVPRGDKSAIDNSLNTFTKGYCSDIKNLCVLVICDNVVIREQISTLLKNWKCNTITVSSVNDARDQLTKNKFIPDVIISDYNVCTTETGIFALNIINDILNETLKVSVPGILITTETSVILINQTELY
ncbi:MAG: ATP-binding protein, partial [Candidatus Heimdallarchaeota archaeon]